MASLTYTPTTLQEVLAQLNLSQYSQALIDAGYDMLNRFDTENNTVKELTEELKEDVPMKKPHARALVRYLFSQQHQPLLSAPGVHDADDDDLPIAEAIPMSRGLNNNPPSFDPVVPTVDPKLLEKEIRAQMERDYENKAANERAVWMEEHAQKEAAVVVAKEKAENQRDDAKKELALLKESLANQAKGESKESSSSSCPEGALRVQPGWKSFSNAVKEAKRRGIDCLFLLKGVHDENGETVEIDFALKVVGQNKDDVKIRAGLWIKGKKEEDVFFTDCTVTGAKEHGVQQYGETSAAMHLKNVCVEKCGYHGVSVYSTTRNTMTDCNVNNNKMSGVYVGNGGCMIIDGSATTIHHNVTGGRSDLYGLLAYHSPSSIHLKSLTKESISTNNGGGGNYGGLGTIKTI
jgi:parallel beta-helix repeat protein